MPPRAASCCSSRLGPLADSSLVLSPSRVGMLQDAPRAPLKGVAAWLSTSPDSFEDDGATVRSEATDALSTLKGGRRPPPKRRSFDSQATEVSLAKGLAPIK